MGANNQSYLVRSRAGSYVLKWYRNEASLERLRFEHELLNALAAAGLPFAVPSPLQTRSGETSVEITRDYDVYRVSLFNHIPGRAALFGSRSEGYRCGKALAILDQSLDTVMLEPAVPLLGAFGDLTSIHASNPHPLAAIQQLFGDNALVIALTSVMTLVEERWQLHTSGWSSRLIHGDFYPTNTLVDSGQVSGILDFEFSGLGYRVMDFSVGLAAFSTKSWDHGCSWPLLESFATGYLQRSSFSEEELAAMPVLLLMREVTSFVHWLGRMEQGLTTFDDVHFRARRLLSLHQWLEENQGRLLQRLDRINR